MENKSFNAIQSKYPKIRKKLMKYPGVIKVAIGLKETNNIPTGETTITVFVEEKRDLSSLKPKDVIPREIEGIPIDVIQQKKYEDEEPPEVSYDEEKYRPVQPGCYITPDGGSGGTLGFIGTLVSDSTRVIVSNHHVLYESPAADGTESGQPKISSSCCCKCNDIAVNVFGIKSGHLDCAIARVKDGVKLNDEILEIGVISDTETVVANLPPGTDVKKRGMATRLTTGKIHHLVLDGTGTVINEIVVKKDNGNKRFSYPGDSGSALLTLDNKLIGLHKSGANGDAVVAPNFESVAIGISEVMDAFTTGGFQITISMHGADEKKGGSYIARNNISYNRPAVNIEPVEYFEKELAQTTYGREILKSIHQNREEVAQLINRRRPVTLVWHRNQGPAFMTHFMNSIRDSSYKIPNEVRGISLQQMLIKMAEVLRSNGSGSLRTGIDKYGMDILFYSDRFDSLHSLLKNISERRKETQSVPL